MLFNKTTPREIVTNIPPPTITCTPSPPRLKNSDHLRFAMLRVLAIYDYLPVCINALKCKAL
ncbi:MAG: hypothetical protein QGI29_06535, partial [Pirellulales bacterium]|nr:hypothetical protein [Pirellulales bacterium]